MSYLKKYLYLATTIFFCFTACQNDPEHPEHTVIVKDKKSAAIENAEIFVTYHSSNVTVSAKTDQNGQAFLDIQIPFHSLIVVVGDKKKIVKYEDISWPLTVEVQ